MTQFYIVGDPKFNRALEVEGQVGEVIQIYRDYPRIKMFGSRVQNVRLS